MLTFSITAVLAIFGAVISYFQWRAAQQKVAIDLLGARYKIYDDLRAAVSEFLTTARFPDETRRKFMEAQSRARFHFGPEVELYLNVLRHDIIVGHLTDRFAGMPRANSNVDEQIARLDRIDSFYAEFDKMVIPLYAH